MLLFSGALFFLTLLSLYYSVIQSTQLLFLSNPLKLRHQAFRLEMFKILNFTPVFITVFCYIRRLWYVFHFVSRKFSFS